VPLTPYRPNIPLNLALALVTGLGLGCALVAWMERQDARVRCAEDLILGLQVPLLAVLSSERQRAGLLARPPGTPLRALPGPG
jgi:capsular polysaccharide biosynthesis protein